MTEKEKMLKGMLYDANNDPALIAERMECKEKCRDYNDLRPADTAKRNAILKSLLGKVGGDILIEQPFYCDYGYNIEVGKNFYANFNLVILDEAPVRFGDNVFVAPNCSFYTAGHPLDPMERNKGLEYARPITIGHNVWIGGNVCVLPGVTIGDNSVIGAGSVVVGDIPARSVAVGNPCRVVKQIL
ncbi:MAG: sugar O-acetyltransferase [Muribaculaceae bacterium]|nr:sugar O-acetyltransferase [Muribaculaceae bacterium]